MRLPTRAGQEGPALARGLERRLPEVVLRLLNQIDLAELPPPDLEVRFDPTRLWRFDLAYPAVKLAAEYEGASWTAGAHQRPARFRQDAEKYNAGVLAGWRILRFTADMVRDGSAIATLKEALAR